MDSATVTPKSRKANQRSVATKHFHASNIDEVKTAKMRIDPTPLQTEEQIKDSKERIDAITKKVAIVVAFVSVFIWFVKIIFL